MNKIKKGDKVQVLLGKDRGKSGQVVRVLSDLSKVLVEGVNLYKRHVKKQKDVEGGIIELAKVVDISNVALVCPNCNKPTRVGFDISEGGKTKARICKKCQKRI